MFSVPSTPQTHLQETISSYSTISSPTLNSSTNLNHSSENPFNNLYLCKQKLYTKHFSNIHLLLKNPTQNHFNLTISLIKLSHSKSALTNTTIPSFSNLTVRFPSPITLYPTQLIRSVAFPNLLHLECSVGV